MSVKSKVTGAARKIVVKLSKSVANKEDIVLGAEAIPGGSRFNPSGDHDAVAAPEKKPPVMVG